MFESFEGFFQCATGFEPYPYQVRLATGVRFPPIVSLPTGAGKTAAVVLAWLWRRLFAPDGALRADTPRRLAYCLPMRVLVEQSAQSVRGWLARLGAGVAPGYQLNTRGDVTAPPVQVHILMGGEADDEWTLEPDREAVLVGTQDMLLSRALNRGYGMTRFRWPMGFGLLSNDCLWVFDEVQLMGSGLATSAQLHAFRQKLGTFGRCHSMWMSATCRPEWVATVDLPAPSPEEVFDLGEDDLKAEVLAQRLGARKTVRKWEAAAASARRRPNGAERARFILARHLPASQTLCIANTVERATILYSALCRELDRASGVRPREGERRGGFHGRPGAETEVLLVHSRFRPPEREDLNARLAERDLKAPGGRIIVSTQVVEAGVDISSRTLVTEVAPWASMVQRVGRCNRFGEHEEAEVWWLDLPRDQSPPYDPDELELSRRLLSLLEGGSASPKDLPPPEQLKPARHVIRMRDFLDLFDTTPDLSGNDVDVSRFIRDTEDLDVQVFWRELEGKPPGPGVTLPHRSELCSAPVGEVRDFARRKRLWRWDQLTGSWALARGERIRPGQIMLADSADGGYDPLLGWAPTSNKHVAPVGLSGEPDWQRQSDAALGTDAATTSPGAWVTVAAHSDKVVAEVSRLVESLGEHLPAPYAGDLRIAARWHDAGKRHPVFQRTMLEGLPPEEAGCRQGQTWAKCSRPIKRHERRYFRHELVSALSLLQSGATDLAVYLVAAHHGKVRLAIRSMPGEWAPRERRRFALGVWDGDEVPEADLGHGVVASTMVVDLSLMEMGLGEDAQRSWLDRMLALRDSSDLGPFRLAFLESLLRAADMRASAAEVSADVKEAPGARTPSSPSERPPARRMRFVATRGRGTGHE